MLRVLSASVAFVMFDDSVGGVVVDGFEVFGGDAVGLDARVGIEARGDVAHDVFDEFGVFVGALGDVFFVRPLQRRPDFAGAFFFADADEAWLDFVMANRQGVYQGRQYDLIYGAVANDDVYRVLALYMTGVMDREQTLTALKIRRLFNQLVFATEKALQYLHFEGRELV